MSRVKYNQGIQGTVNNYGAMSVGSQSRAQQVTAQSDPNYAQELRRLQEQVEALQQAIRAQAASFGGAEHLLRQTSQVSEELKKEHPNKSGIMQVLESLTTGLTSASGLAKAAAALKTAVVAFL
jgi:hypothetical protein